MYENILKEAELYRQEIVAIRRDLHRFAESAWSEFRTTAKIVTFLREKGIPVIFGRDVINPDYAWSYPTPEQITFYQQRAVSQGADPALVEAMKGYTGAVATIDTGKPGPVYVFRFDIDCNDLDETADPAHLPNREGFASVNPHCMHACGHDAHTAIGLVLAAVLHAHRAELCGVIRIIFQPAEEGDKGARSMVERGVLDDADRVFGMHLYPARGVWPAICGTQMGLYATTKFDVTITGRSTHAGASPEEGHNAILAAVHAINGMQAFGQDGRGCTRLNIGTIEGGTGRNVVPCRCFFRAETRGSTTEVEKRLYEAAVRSVKTACELYGCTYEIRTMGYGPQGDGDLDLAEEIVSLSEQLDDFKARYAVRNNTGSTDDFAYMMEALQKRGKKACYMALETAIMGSLHSEQYSFDESCLIPGVKMCALIAARMMAEDPQPQDHG